MAGENHLIALRRELVEETGRLEFDIGPHVWTRTFVFESTTGEVRQHERYYLIRSERFDPEPSGMEGLERDWFGGYRWWSVEEILVAADRFAPRGLGTLLEALMAGSIPDRPILLAR